MRLSASEGENIKKALDIGAAGIIAPMVNSADKAQEVVRHAKYAPLGTRGVGIGRASGYGMNLKGYVDRANEQTTVVVQAEHIEAVENIEAIVQVEGVDAVLIGPYDLSSSLGIPGNFKHNNFIDVEKRILSIAKKFEKAVGIHVISTNWNDVKLKIQEGFNLIIYSADMLFLGSIIRKSLNNLSKSIKKDK